MTCAEKSCTWTEELRECVRCEYSFCSDHLEGGHCAECREIVAHEAFLDAADRADEKRIYNGRMGIFSGTVIR